MVQFADPITCPDCESARVARILYGTDFDLEALDRELAAGTAVLGGSWMKHAPKWECQDCHHRWGGAPPVESNALLNRDRLALRRKILHLLGQD